MFTFGIFTTHLPYIAFVVFYAGLWIFGNEETTANDMGIDDGFVSKVSAFPAGSNINAARPIFDDVLFCHFKDEVVNFKFFRILSSIISTYKTPLKNISFRFSRFSRPPPFA